MRISFDEVVVGRQKKDAADGLVSCSLDLL
jgi:hypothetical protein